MPSFFPRHTVELRIEEPQAFRKLSYKLVEMAIATGVLWRIYRVLAFTHGTNNWLYAAVVITFAAVFLVGMLTAHLANYPLHQYLWRAPAFAGIEVLAEMATSALLLAVGLEANGSVRAHWDDWPGMALNAVLVRGLIFIGWGLILAGVVKLVQRVGVQEDDEPKASS
ncbi:MAG TPA: hypothetical protein VGM82_05070 [Gemmatimonadaceae bacterium]|jgi:hypothetical protein